jgi:hypothetical protein
MPLARMKFISDKIQLNDAAHGSDYRAMGIAWAASGRHNLLLMNIKKGNGVKKELFAGECPIKKRNRSIKSSRNATNRKRDMTVII